MSARFACLAAVAAAVALSSPRAQVLVAPFDAIYSLESLGPVSGVATLSPASGGYAGVAFKYDDPDTLVISTYYRGFGPGIVYSVPLTRDSVGHITGFGAAATEIARTTKTIWSGPAYGPSNLLWSAGSKDFEEFKPGSSTPDKVAPLGLVLPTQSLAFVPIGFPGGGSMKWTDTAKRFFDVALVPTGSGTYDVGAMTQTAVTFDRVNGIAYVPPASPYFRDNSSVLLVETNTYGHSRIEYYDIDGSGNPIGSPRNFIKGFDSGVSGKPGILGPAFDPRTGDLLFCTPDGGHQVMIVRGFGKCTGPLRIPSSCGGGSVNVSAAVCGTVATCTSPLKVTGAEPNSVGAVLIGGQSAALPLLGGTLGTIPLVTVPYTTNSLGSSAGFLCIRFQAGWAGGVIYLQPATLTSCQPSGIGLGSTAFIGFH